MNRPPGYDFQQRPPGVLRWRRHDLIHQKFDSLLGSLFRLTTKNSPRLPHYWFSVKEVNRWLLDSLHKGPVMQKGLSCHGVLISNILSAFDTFIGTFCVHKLVERRQQKVWSNAILESRPGDWWNWITITGSNLLKKNKATEQWNMFIKRVWTWMTCFNEQFVNITSLTSY